MAPSYLSSLTGLLLLMVILLLTTAVHSTPGGNKKFLRYHHHHTARPLNKRPLLVSVRSGKMLPGFQCSRAGYFSHETDCTRFYHCVDYWGQGKRFTRFEYQCAAGTMFDPSLSVCNHPVWIQPKPTCLGSLLPGIIAPGSSTVVNWTPGQTPGSFSSSSSSSSGLEVSTVPTNPSGGVEINPDSGELEPPFIDSSAPITTPSSGSGLGEEIQPPDVESAAPPTTVIPGSGSDTGLVGSGLSSSTCRPDSGSSGQQGEGGDSGSNSTQTPGSGSAGQEGEVVQQPGSGSSSQQGGQGSGSGSVDGGDGSVTNQGGGQQSGSGSNQQPGSENGEQGGQQLQPGSPSESGTGGNPPDVESAGPLMSEAPDTSDGSSGSTPSPVSGIDQQQSPGGASSTSSQSSGVEVSLPYPSSIIPPLVAPSTEVPPSSSSSNSSSSSSSSSSPSSSSFPASFVLICNDQDFHRHPAQCNLYYQCVWTGFNFNINIQTCLSGLVFDDSSSTCRNPAESAPCNDSSLNNNQAASGEIPPNSAAITTHSPITIPSAHVSSSSTEEISSNITPSSVSESTIKPQYTLAPGSLYNCKVPGHFPYQLDCIRFYRCFEVSPGILKGLLYRCPDGYGYSIEKKWCVRIQTILPCDRSNVKVGDWPIPIIPLEETTPVLVEDFESFFSNPNYFYQPRYYISRILY